MGRSTTNDRKMSRVSYLGDGPSTSQAVGNSSPKRGATTKKKSSRKKTQPKR